MAGLPKLTVNKTQGVGAPISGKDHYTGLLFYVDQATEYPVGIVQIYAAAAFAINDILEYTDYKIYKVLTTNVLTGTPATDVSAADVIELTDSEDLAEARTARVDISNMDTLGIIEGGNADKIWYVMDQFFQKNPSGFAWIRLADEGLTTTTFDEIDDLVIVSDGDVRKVGVYNNGNSSADFAVSQVVALQAKYAEYYAGFQPINIAYFPIAIAEAHASFLDLHDNGSNFGVSVYNAFDSVKADADYPAMGVIMGYWAIAKISQSIGYVRSYNMIALATGSNTNLEYEKFALLDSSGFISWAELKGAAGDALNDLGWNFFTKQVGISGTYVNNMYTATVLGTNSDRAFFDATLNKASRLVRAALLPELNGEVQFNPVDGTMLQQDIDRFIALSDDALESMSGNDEISGSETVIDGTQDVASTNELLVTVNIVLNGVTEQITVSLTRVNALG
jgi:hypothetical protein